MAPGKRKIKTMDNANFKELIGRLQHESRRSELLNCASKNTNKRMDLGMFRVLQSDLPETILDKLTAEEWEGKVSLTSSSDLAGDGFLSPTKLHSSLRKILGFRHEMISELGFDSLFIGYPLLVHHDENDRSNDVVAPLFLWKVDAAIQSRNKELSIIRKRDFGVLQNKTLDLWLQSKGFPGLPAVDVEDEDSLSSEELTKFIEELRERFRIEQDPLLSPAGRMIFQSIREMREVLPPGWHVLNHAVWGNFKATNVSVIEDLETYMSQKPVGLGVSQVSNNQAEEAFRLVSSRLDPSQSNVLKTLSQGKGMVVHGPPGTGKSTVITNVIADQLLSHNRVLMVCQKTTALRVIQEKLAKIGLGDHVVLIQNVQSDRQRVVRQARQMLELDAPAMPRSALDKEQQLMRVHERHAEHQNAHKTPVFWDWNWTECASRWDWEKKALSFHQDQMDWLKGGEVRADELASYQGVLLAIDGCSSLWETLATNVPSNVRISKNWQEWTASTGIWEAGLKEEASNWEEAAISCPRWEALGSAFQSWCTAPRWWWKLKTLFVSSCKELEEKLGTFNEEVRKELHAALTLEEAGYRAASQWRKRREDLELLQGLRNREDDVVQLIETLSALQESGFDPWLNQTWIICASSNWKEDLVQALIAEAVNERRGLAGMLTNDRNHREADRLMNEIIELKKQEVRHVTLYRAREAIYEFNNKTGFKRLYNLAAGKKNGPRNSLRAIVDRDPDLFSELFPVLLTTPDVASALYQGVRGFFDLVLFDEASQVRVEESLAASLKGKRILVAGDEHQMPPSSYFRSQSEEDVSEADELTDDALQRQDLQVESLLDYAIRRNDLSETFLDFHYRSKHPDLIRFSNAAFYGRLVPAPHRESQPMPIVFHDVQGEYGSSRNVKEAEAMVIRIREMAMHALQSGQAPSIGIATLNLPQKNEVEKQLQHSREVDKDFDSGLIALEEAGLFIRNLENIQGDERDVMLIGTTFGKDEKGKFSKNMGMLIKQQGHRYLNVLVTRAKERLEVFSSVPSEEFETAVATLEKQQENAGGPLFLTWVYLVKSMSAGDDVTTDRLISLLEANNPSHMAENHVSQSDLKLAEALCEKMPDVQERWTVGRRLGGVTLELSQGTTGARDLDFGSRTLKGYSSLEGELHRKTLLNAVGIEPEQIWLPRLILSPAKFLDVD